MLYLVMLLALMIPVIAGINFTNLSTARSMRRTREIGMRKVLGAYRPQLIGQFLGESVFVTLVSLGIGAVVARAVLPTFNTTFGMQLPASLLVDPVLIGVLVGFGLVLGLLSGLYPALVLSGKTPVAAMRGSGSPRTSGTYVRRGLVITQFSFSFILLIGTLIVWRQIDYMKTRDLAIDTENVLIVGASPWEMEDPDVARGQIAAIGRQLADQTAIRKVSFSQVVPGKYWENYNSFSSPDAVGTESIRLRQAWVDSAYFDTYGMRFIEGRTFREADGAEADGADADVVVINEAAMKAYGWTRAVGKRIVSGGSGSVREIVGVVADYHYQSLQNAIEPVFHFPTGRDFTGNNWMSIAIVPGRTEEAVSLVTDAWDSLGSSVPLDYWFLDEGFNELYRLHRLFGTTVGVFAVLSILIACMGMVALVALATQQRTKEIGVRKVLGARAEQIVALVSKEFVVMLAAAFVLAVPLAWLGMDRWLQEFAYRAPIGIGVYLAAGIGMFVFAGLAVSWQTIRAARVDPVDSLRYE